MSDWNKASSFKKRINGFFVYQLSSFLALICPIATDRVMLKVLMEQFEMSRHDFTTAALRRKAQSQMRLRKAADVGRNKNAMTKNCSNCDFEKYPFNLSPCCNCDLNDNMWRKKRGVFTSLNTRFVKIIAWVKGLWL